MPSATPERSTTDLTPLGQNRTFNLFFAGQLFSYFGDATVMVLLPLLVLATTGSVAQMGLVTTAIGVGRLVAGVVSGSLADRYDRRRIMLVCDAGRTVVYLAIAIAWWLGFSHVGLLYGLGCIGGALGTCFAITQLTALPSLVHRSQLTAANGRLMAGYGAAMFAGPLIGGMLSSLLGAASATGLNAIAFALSAGVLVRIRLRSTTLHDGSSPAADPRDRALLLGVRFLWREPTLRSVALLMIVSVLLVTGGNDLFIFHLKENLGQGDDAVGAVFGMAALGAVIGGALASVLRRALGFGTAFLGTLVLQGVFMALIGTADTVYGVAGAAVIFAFGNSGSRVYSMSIRQELTPEALLGRVTSAFWILGAAIGPLGAAGAALLAEVIGAREVLMLTGIAAALAGVLGMLTPARTRHPVPAAASADNTAE